MSAINQKTFDLSVKNPNKGDEAVLRSPKEILSDMRAGDIEIKKIFSNLGKSI